MDPHTARRDEPYRSRVLSGTGEGVMTDTAHRQAEFEGLQRKLVPLWESIRAMTQDEQTIVVVPSITLDSEGLTGSMMQAYEERFLFLLLLLRQPRARLVYVTSQAIHPTIVDYYLDLLPGVIASHARARLFLPSPLDASPGPLSEKLLARPKLIRRIRDLISDADRAHLVPYNTTEIERDLAVALGIPMYGADPKHFPLGTKSGCRQLFAEEGIPHPIGFEDLYGPDDLVRALSKMRAAKPGIRQALAKLNEGVSALGEVERLPTHAQLFGGPSGQSYLGARSPADRDYAGAITREAAKIGARLAREGVIGRFALDFVVVRSNGTWEPFAIELNLRKGGTTHPFLTLQFLTDGAYDPDTGVFTAPSGKRKAFVASDHIEGDAYRGLTHDDLFDIVVRNGLHFDQARQTGVVFHMISALPQHGRVGLTAIGESDQQAQELYERTVATLDREVRAG